MLVGAHRYLFHTQKELQEQSWGLAIEICLSTKEALLAGGRSNDPPLSTPCLSLREDL
jgi:hypothetical protein